MVKPTANGVAQTPPGLHWPQDDPQHQRLSAAALDGLADSLIARGNTKSLLILRNDRIVLERYASDHGPRRRHYTASAAKGVVGGCALMFALQDGLMVLDDPACKYVPQWRDPRMGDPRKSKITVRHLATHCAGLEDPTDPKLPKDQIGGWKSAFWQRRDPPNDPFTLSREQAPVLFEPGSAFHYSNSGIAMLAYAVTAAIKPAYPHIRAMLEERLMRPLGVPDDDWSIGYGRNFLIDGLTLHAAWGGGEYTARALAAVASVMLHEGVWDGRQIVGAEWVRATVAYGKTAKCQDPADLRPTAALGWWNNEEGAIPVLPRDAFFAAGAEQQLAMAVPSLDLVLIRQGSGLGGPFWRKISEKIIQPLMGCLLPPAPPSPAIRAIEWASKDLVVRDGYHCDNWPATWADDGHLYTAWGDGWGFEPYYPRKLSMGIGRVEGDPPLIRCFNISSNAQDVGQGNAGRKACGLLSIDGVLYMLVRNADHKGNQSLLGWSSDHGRTFTWAAWRFEEFGCCTFLNFGRDYSGARDGFVYVYSHDNPSAYVPADRMILVRVPKDRLRVRDAYEFFAGLSSSGKPRWSANVSERAAVFENRHRCLRGGVSYNAALRRYLWWQQIPNHSSKPDTRFRAGFATYDAPEPWGPWTTAYYTEDWDIGPGETGCIPTKWIAPGGLSFQLVFSGDDYLSIRRGTISPVDAPAT